LADLVHCTFITLNTLAPPAAEQQILSHTRRTITGLRRTRAGKELHCNCQGSLALIRHPLSLLVIELLLCSCPARLGSIGVKRVCCWRTIIIDDLIPLSACVIPGILYSRINRFLSPLQLWAVDAHEGSCFRILLPIIRRRGYPWKCP
jgi:hypothetical protein